LIPILPEIDVRAVALSAAGVWCATEKDGLMRVVRDPVFGWITSRLDVEQGLPSQRVFTLLKTDERTFLIGTNRGLVRYRMPDTRPILIPTRVLSRRLHGPEELSSPITLDFPQNTLTVEVAGISSRTFPEQFQYAFLLRNEEGELLQQRLGRDSQLLMNNLPPGGYALEIVALDKNLIASESRRIEFKVEKPPFPLVTLALTVLLLLALIALAWAIYSQRRIFQKSAELKSANRELSGARLDLVNEAERERRRISRDLHDQTLADLRHLQLLADKLAPTPETAETAQVFRREIENVSHEIRRICEDLTPSVLENIGFAAALEWALNNSLDTGPEARKFETEFRFDENLDENPPLAPGEQIQIYRIVQEVLNNIARHAAASKVNMSVEKRPDGAFRLEIEDDGKFFEPPAKTGRRGRGLSNISSRASLIEADISFTPGAAGGTIFTLVKAAGKNTVAIHNSLAQ
jgi:signal transduction histidine kinase